MRSGIERTGWFWNLPASAMAAAGAVVLLSPLSRASLKGTTQVPDKTQLYLIELRGACDVRGRYDLHISVFGQLRAKHLRNIIKQLDIQAAFLEEDETQEAESSNG